MERQKEFSLRGKRALVVGMARSGIASARLLFENGAQVIINDSKQEIPGLYGALKGITFEAALGVAPETLLGRIDLMVLSPGVPLTAAFAQSAIKQGIEVIGEIELGYRFSRGEFVAISGTNGKTTTTALTGEVFKSAGFNTHVLGNIGTPVTQEAPKTKAGDIIVTETAALQMESIKFFHPRAAAMLNISEDHLDRFGSMQNYIAAKCRVFENQRASDFAVLNYEDPIVREMAALTKARAVYFSSKRELDEGVFVREGKIVFALDGACVELVSAQELKIPGEHNLENAMAAAALALLMGAQAGGVAEGLRRFPGFEHRIEFVCEKRGVRYINDSKGTNPDSTIKAVRAMQRPTVLILGGYDKHADFAPLFREFGGKIKAVVALGATAPQVMRTAAEEGFTDIHHCEGSFEEAVRLADSLAQSGDNLLLSPACASWDMFRDFEQRGEVFKQIVAEL